MKDQLPANIRRDDDAFVDREYHPTLADQIRAAGGQWVLADPRIKPARLVQALNNVGAKALRTEPRNISALRDVRGLWHVDIESDGVPNLQHLSELNELQSLHLSTRGIRGDLSVTSFPKLKWLSVPLGGKGGASLLSSIVTHGSEAEYLRVKEGKLRSLQDLTRHFPRLRTLQVSYADHLRSPGDLSDVARSLSELSLWMVPGLRSLEGIETATALSKIKLESADITDLRPLLDLPELKTIDIRLAGGVRITSVEALQEHVRA